MIRYALVGLFLVGCSSSASTPAVIDAVRPPMLDAGAVDPGADAATTADGAAQPDAGEDSGGDPADAADSAPPVDAGEDSSELDSSPGVDPSKPDTGPADAGACTLASAGENVCSSYGLTNYVMFFCPAGHCAPGTTLVSTPTPGTSYCCAPP